MLKNAVLLFYQAGHKNYARRIYNELRKRYPERKELKVPLIQFARKALIQQFNDMTIHDAREMIVMMMSEAYFRYALHDDDEVFGREQMVKEIYEEKDVPPRLSEEMEKILRGPVKVF